MNQSFKEGKEEGEKEEEGGALNQPVSGPPLPPSRKEGQEGKGKVSGTQEKIPRRRVPKTAAVSIKGKKEGFSSLCGGIKESSHQHIA